MDSVGSCGPITYRTNAHASLPFSIEGGNVLTLGTNDPAQAMSSARLQIEATLDNYPSIPMAEDWF